MLGILGGIDLCEDDKGVVSRYPARSLKFTRSLPTLTVLHGLVPIDALGRRRLGEPRSAPHIRIDGVLDRLRTPGVLEGSHGAESGVALTPGKGDIAVHMPARHFDSAVKLTTKESRLSVHDRVEWRPWWDAGVK